MINTEEFTTGCSTSRCARPMRYQNDVCQLQYRLSRASHEVQGLLTTAPVSFSSIEWVRVRRLGNLLTSAIALAAKLECARRDGSVEGDGEGIAARCLLPNAAESTVMRGLQERVEEVYHTLQETVLEAQRVLEQAISAVSSSALRVPLTCVGAIPRTCVPLDSHPGSAYAVPLLVFTEGPRGSGAGQMPISYTTVAKDFVSPSLHERATRAPSQKAPSSSTGQQDRNTLASVVPDAEAAAVLDVKEAIRQMKEGALQMSELMSQERDTLAQSEQLLSDGVSRSRQQIKELDRLPYLSSASYAPQLLQRIPGGHLLWQTVVLPLWETMKQALFISAVLVVTVFSTMVMLMRSKPQRIVM